MDEAELIGAAQGGDRAGVRRAGAPHLRRHVHLACRLTGNEEDARDVVQDAYLRAWRGIGKFRGEAQFSTWMYRITANAAATHIRKRRRHRTEPLDDDFEPADTRPEAQPVSQGRVGRGARPDRRARSTSCRPSSAQRRRAEGRLRPVARGHRRRARHLGRGGEGPAAPGPPQAAGRAVRRRSGSPCGVTRSPRCCPASSTATPTRSRGRAPRRVVPALPGRAGAVPPAAAHPASCCGPGTSSRRPGCSATRSPRSTEAAERGRVPHRCHGRRLAYAGAIGGTAVATGGHRRRPHRPVAPARRSASPAERAGAAATAAGRSGTSARRAIAEARCYPRGPAPGPEGSSSIGRAPVSKTGGWGFESLLPCSTCSRRESVPDMPVEATP